MDDVKYLFVYGMLKRKRILNYLLLLGFNFIGEAILKNAELYKYNFSPLIISGKDEVFGELYKIKKQSHLLLLDKVEHNYNRIISDVKIKNKIVKAFVYFYKFPDFVRGSQNFIKIKSGNWGINNDK